jgi:DNA-binding LacI/PurR family transcriptional regulator
VTLQTVADHLGVSRMTVSNAFSRPDQLSDELRRKILAVADELGYAGPDPSGRALARGRTGAIGVMLTDSLEYAFTDQLATDLMASITSELAPTGLALTLLTTATRDDFIPARDVPIDGAIVFSCAADSTAVEWLRRRKLPMVFVDQDPVDDVTCINIDEAGGARAAAQHVVDLGHRRVAIVTSGDDPIGIAPAIGVEHGKYSQRNRMRGWLDVLTVNGITPTVLVVRHGREGGFEAAESLFDLPPDERPTAILCYSDTLAVGVLAASRRRGISIPAELSVVGFDDARFASTTDPPLTTVRQDIVGKGSIAAATLTEAIAAGKDAAIEPKRVMLETHLVVRQSTAPVHVTAS